MEAPRPTSRTLELYARELNRLRRVAEAGSELAPAAGMFFCATYDVAVPRWLVLHAARGYCMQVRPNRNKKRGRAAGPIDRYRQDLIDSARWEDVRDVRYKQREYLENALAMRSYKNVSPREREECEKRLAWIGHDWDRAYECASMRLRGTPAFGGPDAMKKSYCRVEASNELPAQSWRYFLFDPDFLSSIGVQHPSRWGRSTKFEPFYNLTL
ncbi:MAG: hypothetical protein JWL86_187 [Rhizobium sp.]|nr:hypothetical protein [Rhizobium sp.]